MQLSVVGLAMVVMVGVAVMAAVTGALPPPSPPYHILMPIVFSTRSHLNVFSAIATALAQRGNKVRFTFFFILIYIVLFYILYKILYCFILYFILFLYCCHRSVPLLQPSPSVGTTIYCI